jgi:mannitol-1-phosphate/altronate dehydrogenase
LGIAEISLRGSTSIAQDLRDQEMAFCVLETSAHGSETRLIRTVTGATDIAHEGYGRVEEWFAQPELSIIFLTVTEKGYCVHPSTCELNLDHPDITHDLLNPQQPKSAIGLIAKAISARYDLAFTGISVLSCDNMPENGDVLKAAVVGFLLKVNPEVANWAKSNVRFPSTMVDRIVPAMTEHSHQQLKALVSAEDKCGVVGESCKQWVIEDNFVAGRPNWQLAGASLVSDVVPYE